jgi:hypothetical protein
MAPLFLLSELDRGTYSGLETGLCTRCVERGLGLRASLDVIRESLLHLTRKNTKKHAKKQMLFCLKVNLKSVIIYGTFRTQILDQLIINYLKYFIFQ